MEQFADYAYYYNAFYKDKDYVGETKDIDHILKKYGSGIKSIIVFGCGTGGHDEELVRLGYKVHGIDMSRQMIEVAQDRSKRNKTEIEYEVADIREYNPRSKYDAVVSLFHVMSYQNSNKDFKAAISSARKALPKGGLFVFDTWYGPGVLSDPPAVRVKEAEDDDNRLIRLCRPCIHCDINVVDVGYEVLIIDKKTSVTRTICETHNMRYFFRPEIEELLAEEGFELVDCLDCQNMNATDFNSWTAYFIAKVV